jgi:hypothetical protein
MPLILPFQVEEMEYAVEYGRHEKTCSVEMISSRRKTE